MPNKSRKSFGKHPMELLDDEAQVEYLVSICLEIVLVLVQDRCMVCSKQGLEIILTAPDRTPR